MDLESNRLKLTEITNNQDLMNISKKQKLYFNG
jgi:hypothetical protein